MTKKLTPGEAARDAFYSRNNNDDWGTDWDAIAAAAISAAREGEMSVYEQLRRAAAQAQRQAEEWQVRALNAERRPDPSEDERAHCERPDPSVVEYGHCERAATYFVNTAQYVMPYAVSYDGVRDLLLRERAAAYSAGYESGHAIARDSILECDRLRAELAVTERQRQLHSESRLQTEARLAESLTELSALKAKHEALVNDLNVLVDENWNDSAHPMPGRVRAILRKHGART